MNELILIVAGMSTVTMIPRLIPFFWLKAEKLPPGVQGFFKCLPAAMLTALVIPSVVTASGSAALSLTGAAAAVALSLLRVGPTGTVIGSVGLLYLLQAVGIMN